MQHSIPSAVADPAPDRIPEARYSYYRRCQVFRKNGEQCKAPAEKGSRICYAHAGQQAMALRRKIETAVLLAEAVRRMRARGNPGFEVADIFSNFNSIQITLAVMAQALIDGRIDCKTAGRLAIGLQTAAKLLWLVEKSKTATQPKKNKGRDAMATGAASKPGEMKAPENCMEIGIHLIPFCGSRPNLSPYWARAA